MVRVAGVLQKREKVRGPGEQSDGAGGAELPLPAEAPQYAPGDPAGRTKAYPSFWKRSPRAA